MIPERAPRRPGIVPNGHIAPARLAAWASPGDRPLPGEGPLTGAALAIGLLLLAIQLWLLTVALDLYLAGNVSQGWALALGSGLIFLGGVIVLAVLRRRPHVRQPTGDEAPYAVGAWGNPPAGD